MTIQTLQEPSALVSGPLHAFDIVGINKLKQHNGMQCLPMCL